MSPNYNMSIAKSMFLSLVLLAAARHAQQTATANDQAAEIQRNRDKWCGSTNTWDRRYNSLEQSYLRMSSGGVFGDYYPEAFRFYSEGGVENWIRAQRWATALLIIVVIISFISWIVWLGFCCAGEEKNRSVVLMRMCVILAWILFVLFLGLFIVVMIFIAHSAISQRRSRCQALNVANMVVNGYRSHFNGNQYVGLQQYSLILNNLGAEATNLLQAVPPAQNIISSTSQFWASNAYSALNTFYAAHWQRTTVGALRETTIGNFVSELSPSITEPIGEDVGRLLATANGLNGLALAVPSLGNSGFQTTVAQTISHLSSNINAMRADFSDFSLHAWNKSWERYTYANGGYWSIFAISIVMIFLIQSALFNQGRVWAAEGTQHNRTAFKWILGLGGFFLVWYGIVVIILLAGSTSISTFCTVLAAVNTGRTEVLDTLPVSWETNKYGLSRQIIKYCASNGSGDLLNFANTYTNAGYSVQTAEQIKNLVAGIVAYQAFISGPIPTHGSNAVNLYHGHLSNVASGITENAVGVRGLNDILNRYIQSTGVTNAISSQLCDIQSKDRNCLRDDVLNSFSALPSFANSELARPYYDNLQAYILSQQHLVRELQDQLSVGVNSVNNQYRMATNVLRENNQNFQAIVNTIPHTLAATRLYRGGLSAYDCKSIQLELAILEDHLCFNLNYWVFILTVITAVSLLFLFFLFWALFSAARHAEGDPIIVASMPQPARVKDDPAIDINEREIIPSM